MEPSVVRTPGVSERQPSGEGDLAKQTLSVSHSQSATHFREQNTYPSTPNLLRSSTTSTNPHHHLRAPVNFGQESGLSILAEACASMPRLSESQPMRTRSLSQAHEHRNSPSSSATISEDTMSQDSWPEQAISILGQWQSAGYLSTRDQSVSNGNDPTAAIRLRPIRPEPLTIQRLSGVIGPVSIIRTPRAPEDEWSTTSSLSTLPALRSTPISFSQRETPFTLPTPEYMVQSYSQTSSESRHQESDTSSSASVSNTESDQAGLGSLGNQPLTSSKSTARSKARRKAASPPDNGSYPPCTIPNPTREQLKWWKGVCREVRRHRNVTISTEDVINHLLARMGHVSEDSLYQQELRREWAKVRKVPLDPEIIKRKMAEEEEEKRRKEERRLANKRRYRPRSEWAKEKAMKEAAAASKRSRADEDEAPAGEGEPAAKRTKPDSIKETGSVTTPSAAPTVSKQHLTEVTIKKKTTKDVVTLTTITRKRAYGNDGSNSSGKSEQSALVDEAEPAAKRLKSNATR